MIVSRFISGVSQGEDVLSMMNSFKGAMESNTFVMFDAVVFQIWSKSLLLNAKDQSNLSSLMVNSFWLILSMF